MIDRDKNILRLNVEYVDNIIYSLYNEVILKTYRDKTIYDILNNIKYSEHPKIVINDVVFTSSNTNTNTFEVIKYIKSNDYKNLKIEIINNFEIKESDDDEYVYNLKNYIKNRINLNSKLFKFGNIKNVNINFKKESYLNFSIFTSFELNFKYKFDINNIDIAKIMINICETEKVPITSILNLIYPIFDIKEYIKDKNLEEHLEKDNLLDYKKWIKKFTDIDRYKMEKDSQFYVFLAKEKFIKSDDGRYDKDLYIENMVKIDPYKTSDLQNVSMMKIRERFSNDETKLYCIWIDNDMSELIDDIDINSTENKFLRDSISNKMEKI